MQWVCWRRDELAEVQVVVIGETGLDDRESWLATTLTDALWADGHHHTT